VEDSPQSNKEKANGKDKVTPEPILEQIVHTHNAYNIGEYQVMVEGVETKIELDEKELAKIDLVCLEEAYCKQELSSPPQKQT
jgi:hypothetical protein